MGWCCVCLPAFLIYSFVLFACLFGGLVCLLLLLDYFVLFCVLFFCLFAIFLSFVGLFAVSVDFLLRLFMCAVSLVFLSWLVPGVFWGGAYVELVSVFGFWFGWVPACLVSGLDDLWTLFLFCLLDP